MHAIPKFPALLFLLSALFLPACRKDMQPLLPASGEAAIRSPQKATPDPLTVPFARDHFQARQRAVQARTFGAPQDSLQLLMGQIELLWDFADTVLYRDTVPLLLVPVATAEAVEPGRQAAMLFFIDSSGYMDSRLLFILADPEYAPPAGGFSDYFTGYLLQVTWDGALTGSFRLQNGILSAPAQQNGLIDLRTQQTPCDDGSAPVLSTYNFGAFSIYIWSCSGSGPAVFDPEQPAALGRQPAEHPHLQPRLGQRPRQLARRPHQQLLQSGRFQRYRPPERPAGQPVLTAVRPLPKRRGAAGATPARLRVFGRGRRAVSGVETTVADAG
ncbi:MAG: hypothetical protein IPH12_20175 [Saprospirales bacterium]|nr:hypothetical protein [Saprospirales bacterium]